MKIILGIVFLFSGFFSIAQKAEIKFDQKQTVTFQQKRTSSSEVFFTKDVQFNQKTRDNGVKKVKFVMVPREEPYITSATYEPAQGKLSTSADKEMKIVEIQLEPNTRKDQTTGSPRFTKKESVKKN